ncbi:MAG: tol-pal system protein YbgF [Gammaproteobacteria bacterium]|nr:tol-pal system protein YbgF [Gammaproteobacteria bacterium]
MQVMLKTGVLLSSLFIVNLVFASPPRTAPEPRVQYGSAPALEGEAEDRLELLEKKVNNNVVYELLEQLRQLQLEISALREISEQQEHQMDLLTKRQRSLYQDVDRRMLELEAGSASSHGATSGRIQPSSGITSSTVDNSGIAAMSKDEADQAREQAAYTKAFNLLKEGNYTQAITAFREFLATYSGGKYADNAQYWLGEANYATRDYKTALLEFQKIVTDYQDSPKRQDAELKIGFTFYELKKWDQAKAALNAVVTQYPDSTNARTAQQRLDRLAREGK